MSSFASILKKLFSTSYSESILARAISFLNDIIRHMGRSSKELWVSRDQTSGVNITLHDASLSDNQTAFRKSHHQSSAKYKSRHGPLVKLPNLQIGDTVFVKSDVSKSKARDSFIVLHLNKENMMATIQKFPMERFRHHPIKVACQNLYKVPSLFLKDSNRGSLSLSSPMKMKATRKSNPKLHLSQPPSYTPPTDSESENVEPGTSGV